MQAVARAGRVNGGGSVSRTPGAMSPTLAIMAFVLRRPTVLPHGEVVGAGGGMSACTIGRPGRAPVRGRIPVGVTDPTPET